MRALIRLGLSVLCLAGAAPSQRTWVVDWRGVGVFDFRDIPPAVAAAAPGDTILVRFGFYTADLVVDKPLCIVGVMDFYPNPFSMQQPAVAGRLTLQNLPAGSKTILSNLWLAGGILVGSPHGLVATNCAGRIHLENAIIDGGGVVNGQVSFTDCADVSIHWGTLAAEGQPVNFVRSRARIANSVVFGKNPGLFSPSARTEAMRVENGEVRLVASLVKGGDGQGGGATGKAGMVLANGTVYAGPGVRIVPGEAVGCGGSTCTWGFAAIGAGTIWKDPDALVWSYPLPPQVPVVVNFREQPAANVALVTRGQTFRALIGGPRGGFALLALGLPSWSPTPTPLGNLWLDPNLILHVGAGPIDATTGVFEQTYACWSGVPMDLLFCYQGGVIWPDGRTALTEPVRFTAQWPVGQSWP